MDIFICDNVFVPLRTEPSHKAEQDSQILFGERYTIVDEIAGWIRVRLLFDGIEGWIDKRHEYLIVSEENTLPHTLPNRLCCKCHNTDYSFTIEAGSDLFNLDFVNKQFSNGLCVYDIIDNPFLEETIDANNYSITDIAMKFVNTPYMWGGRSMLGIDCSGLVQTVMKIKGINLPRNASRQIFYGREIPFHNAIDGDVAFFENVSGKICHVGIILSNGKIIHASGRVRVDIIDENGIYRADNRQYTHSLKTIKRFI